ncbi:MAG: Nif3-like dinuclear metal center hexameric protein [Oscillospiraceae bacterium]|nr:Nif3-like dinuclear metal center hexameric protein [Oscillospiraceae bacterium]
MTTVRDIYNYIDSFAPYRTQDSWDNSGLLVGDGDEPVTKALCALDASIPAILEAEKLGCQLILTHHPVIFDPLKSLDSTVPAALLFKKGIACISSHTNLDSAEYGISDMMVDKLGLKNIHKMVDVNRADPVTGRAVGYGAICECEGVMTPEELARLCKERFDCIAIKYVAGGRNIKTVGMISGAGGSYVTNAFEMGCDAYISGDVKQQDFIEAERLGITLIDAGHFETETIAMEYFKEKLGKQFTEVEFVVSKESFLAKTIG